MKFNFENVLAPELAEGNNNKIVGTLPDDTPVSVERHLSGWDVHLKIVVGGTLWHDSDIEPDEKRQYDELRERAFVRKSDIAEAKRATAHRTATKFLYYKKA